MSAKESTGLELVADLLPTFVVNDPQDPTARLLRRERLYEATATAASGAGSAGWVWVRNPTASGKLVVVERVDVKLPAAGDVLGATVSDAVVVDPSSIVPCSVLDTRGNVGTLTGFYPVVARFGGQNLATSLGGSAWTVSVLAGEVGKFLPWEGGPYILAPGYSFVVHGPLVVGAALTARFRFSERTAGAAELAAPGA